MGKWQPSDINSAIVNFTAFIVAVTALIVALRNRDKVHTNANTIDAVGKRVASLENGGGTQKILNVLGSAGAIERRKDDEHGTALSVSGTTTGVPSPEPKGG